MNFKEYSKLNLKEFTTNYEYAYMHEILYWFSQEPDYDNTKSNIPYREIEIEFVSKLIDYLYRKAFVRINYIQHCIDIGKDYLNFHNNNKDNDWNLKLFYLHKRLGELGIETDLSSFKSETVQKLQEQEKDNEETVIDLSDTKGTEKIIYLKELGVLDHLLRFEPFKNSTNSLATIISAITGINQKTAQSYLNPITNPGVDQKNNPLNSTGKVQRIKNTLTILGFNSGK